VNKWLLYNVLACILQIVSVYRPKVRANLLHVLRLIKGLIFLAVVAILITLVALLRLTMRDIMVCFLALMPTGWGMLLVSDAISCPYFLDNNVRLMNLFFFF